MRRTSIGGLAALLALALAPARAQEPAPAPDAATLADLGRRAAARLAQAPASWTAFFAVGPEFLVLEVLQAPPARRRVEVFVERDAERHHLASILERDGRWFVAEVDGANGLYRPWEAPFRTPVLYAHLREALRPRTADDLAPEALGAWKGVEGRVARWVREVPDEDLRRLDATIERARDRFSTDPKLREDPKFRAHVRWLGRLEEEYLEGAVTKVDLDTGLVLQHGDPGERTAIGGFRWLEAVDEARFAASGGEPPVDAGDDPTRDAPQDLVLFGHCPWWRRGVATQDAALDARLLELGPRRVRRVPYQGALSYPGCLSRDRTRAYVGGRDAQGIGLYEVDLRTGRNRRLGGALLAAGQCLFPTLSPDGKTLAVLHADGTGWGLVHLVDPEGGTARPLGAPLIAGSLAWLPGGDGLVLVTREALDGPEVVSTLDRSGKLTALRAGSAPVPLPDGRLLYFDVPRALWHTCNAAGADARLFHDGLEGLVAPAVSPDGARAAFVEPTTGLVLVDLATGARRTVPLGDGLYGATSWR